MDKILIEKARISRNATSCCFILADIDHFKKINDQYGHDFGDCVLKQLSDILRGSLRSQDYVCRWGGEEFLMVLPDTNIAGATVAAEKLRQKVENSPFSLEKAQIKVTLTMGIALYDSLEDVTVSVHHVDTLSFTGERKNGRNRVEVA
ncbi:hypothetical protein MASR2M78_29590 [Treponema sp.]